MKSFDGEDVYILKLVDTNLTRNDTNYVRFIIKQFRHKIKREKTLNNIKINILSCIINFQIFALKPRQTNIPMK